MYKQYSISSYGYETLMRTDGEDALLVVKEGTTRRWTQGILSHPPQLYIDSIHTTYTVNANAVICILEGT